MEFLTRLTALDGGASGGLQTSQVIIGLLLAFILGQAAAWAYGITHAGLSYSRAFVQSIILLTIVVALGMMVIGNNIVIAFGLIGAFAVVRFRNILKDTRDTAFIFFALVIGMATGTGRYSLAIIGSVVFYVVLLYLHWVQFGNRSVGDGFVRFHVDTARIQRGDLQAVLERHCRWTRLVSQRVHDGTRGELAYSLSVRDPAQTEAFTTELNQIEGVLHVTFALHEEESEV